MRGPHWNVVNLPEVILLQKMASPFPSSYQGNSSSAWSGMQCSHFLEFCEVAWLKFTQIRACWHNCREFVCVVQRTLFPCRNPPPLALAIILFPLPQWSLSLGRRGCNIDLSRRSLMYSIYFVIFKTCQPKCEIKCIKKIFFAPLLQAQKESGVNSLGKLTLRFLFCYSNVFLMN